MFDGKTLDGWKASENPGSWKVVDGTIVGDGPVSHLFWMGRECDNCEFRAEVKLNHEGNSGMYFRTAFGTGFPKGYEAQVENTSRDPQKTGTLYNFARITAQLIQDDTWWTQHIIANGNHIIIKVNDKVVVDYIDSKNTLHQGIPRAPAAQPRKRGPVPQPDDAAPAAEITTPGPPNDEGRLCDLARHVRPKSRPMISFQGPHHLIKVELCRTRLAWPHFASGRRKP